MSDNMVFNIRSISDGWIMGELNDGAHKHFFSYSLFLKLLDISSQKNNINLEEIPAVNNYGSTAIKSSLKAELDIIHLLDFFIED